MSRILVLGAGVCGLAAGMMLARDGHNVIVLERDGSPVPQTPQAAWDRWDRAGVAQFRQAHYLLPAGRAILQGELPDLAAALEAAGGARVDSLSMLPPTITDHSPRPHDDRFITVTARRPVLEQVFGTAAQAQPGLDVRRGVRVTGLTTRAYDGTPQVTGVRTEAGEELHADLVVDAMGRRSPMPGWLAEAGAQPVHEEAEDSGFIYYTRFFGSTDGHLPRPQAPLLTPLGSFSLLTLPGDNHTWAVTVYISSRDQPLKGLRDPDRWTSLVAACPLHAHWLEGEPITGVEAMGGVVDRYRRPVVDGRPVATGIALLADAWACTNPSLGRGITLGLRHAQLLRAAVREHTDPLHFAAAWDAVTEAELAPWYRETVMEDRARVREMEALRHGLEPPPPDPTMAALLSAMGTDADLFRAFLATRAGLTTLGDTLSRPGLMEHAKERARDLVPFPGPDRSQVLDLLQ